MFYQLLYSYLYMLQNTYNKLFIKNIKENLCKTTLLFY